MPRPPTRRTFTERSERRGVLRDVDLAARSRFLQAFAWLAVVGLFWGAFLGFLLSGSVAGIFLGGILGSVGFGTVGGGGIYLITGRVGNLATHLYNPSGSSTPHEKEYSYARSLVARGEAEEAVQVYREHLEEDPTAPEPYLAIARILADELGRHDEAAQWLRRARGEAHLSSGQEILVGRRLIELYRYKLGEPRRAAPELARLAERHPRTPDGEWAARELGELKREMREAEGP